MPIGNKLSAKTTRVCIALDKEYVSVDMAHFWLEDVVMSENLSSGD